MTMAVCIKCGCKKMGAHTHCPDCGFLPEKEEDLSAALALSDWHKGWDELDQISENLIAANPHVKRAEPSEPSQSSFTGR